MRVFMVLSSMAPLFVLWAIRGTPFIPDAYFLPACVAMAVVPTAFLALRIVVARREKDVVPLVAGEAQDSSTHVLVYLLAMLLPIYPLDFESLRDIFAVGSALVLIAWVFWKMNLHYINIAFVVTGYRMYMVSPVDDGNPYSGREGWVLISKRRALSAGTTIKALRVTDTVYMERST